MMGAMRSVTAMLCLPVSLVMFLTSCGGPADRAAHSSGPLPRGSVPAQRLGEPARDGAAHPVPPDARVGAVFLDGDKLHICTASVLHSVGGDLVLTAAHCLLGFSTAAFVPGFSEDAAPTEKWAVSDVYFDNRWLATRDPRADYAIARVRGSGDEPVERRAGAGLTLGAAPVRGSRVTVTGYPAGVGGQPVSCQGSTGTTESGFPSLPCEGLVSGTSGAPWMSGGSVVGVIGGLEGGGCADDVSYSPPFDERTAQLLARAEAGGPGDPPAADYDDSC
ncbi:serine protease [Mycobacterium sp. 1423905.2]|uniref:trypsin-like serine peptidase n=1 Tax=Mycobacterium sp. 1423905.2 TaxID=1856859 RepID=UPI0007FD4704|nr:trypsin-like peptidase domain-containing protein [Mycobacterium sp. 1423905.2]OBJ54159.1 trypsin [Mycobacterium sp. 1423905.2]